MFAKCTLTADILAVIFLMDTFWTSSGGVFSSELTGIRKINGGVPVFTGGLGVGFPII